MLYSGTTTRGMLLKIPEIPDFPKSNFFALWSKMNWVVAIPTYKRPTIIAKKTLATLRNAKVPSDRVFIFVANEDEYAQYAEALKEVHYGTIVVGVRGLVAQREFIQNHFDIGCPLVFIDDDINCFKQRIDEKSMTDITDLPALIERGFRLATEHGSKIWGIYPAPNPYFMKADVSTELCYLMGGFYGIFNTREECYALKHGDNQEDKERTIRYWAKDNKIVRLNDVALRTGVYTKGGMLAENPDRIKDTQKFTQRVADEFPLLVKQIYKKARGIYDLKFLAGRCPTGAKKRTAEGLRDLNVYQCEPRNREYFEKVRDEALAELRKVTIPKIPKPAKDLKDANRGNRLGTDGRTITLGFGDTRHGIKEYATNAKYRDALVAVCRLANAVLPVGWTYNGITLNHNIHAKRHTDSKNTGISYILGIGTFTGGEIKVYAPDGSGATAYNLHDRAIGFNGGLLEHETADFEGERYTMVFYKQRWEGTIAGIPTIGGFEEGLISHSTMEMRSESASVSASAV